MLTEIVKGISMALNAAFGDGYEIFQNDVEQGLEEPCFLIAVLQPEITPCLGGGLSGGTRLIFSISRQAPAITLKCSPLRKR